MSLEAVSYTHLDVYKRQVQKRWLRKRLIYVKLQGRSAPGYEYFSYFVKLLSIC